jgi:hypothetical protein
MEIVVARLGHAADSVRGSQKVAAEEAKAKLR